MNVIDIPLVGKSYMEIINYLDKNYDVLFLGRNDGRQYITDNLFLNKTVNSSILITYKYAGIRKLKVYDGNITLEYSHRDGKDIRKHNVLTPFVGKLLYQTFNDILIWKVKYLKSNKGRDHFLNDSIK